MEIELISDEGDGMRTEHAFGSVHPALASILWRRPLGVSQAWSQPFGGWLEPPRPVVKLMIDLEGAVIADGEPIPTAWAGGLTPHPALVGVTGNAYASIDLELTPLGGYRVLGMPVSELAGQTVALDELLGADGEELVERVRSAPDWATRLGLVESFLLRRAERGPGATPAVARAWDLLVASGGQMRIAALARELRMSRRHLALRFGHETGLTPKTAARLLRFAAVRGRIDAMPSRWADIAADAGYTDQSHLNREFREPTGMSPTAFVARCLERGGVVGEGVPIVQDASEALA